MVRVKVCGLREPEHALAAARLGADLLGLVFAPSRRRVSLQQARDIARALAEEFPRAPSNSGTGVPPVRTGRRPVPLEGYSSREITHIPHLSVGYGPADLTAGPPLRWRRGGAGGEAARPLLVGVFVNQPLEEVDRVASLCGLDYVQLHGDEPPEYCRGLDHPFIKAFRPAPGEAEEEMARRMDSYLAVSPEALFLLDTHLPGVYGGTGLPWEWERATRLAQSYRILVAGGLTPENVASVVRATRPWGVDVSTGVETQGTKDEAKLRAFLEAVRRAEGNPHPGPLPAGEGTTPSPLGRGLG